MGELKSQAKAGENRQVTLDSGQSSGFATTRLEDLLNWARKWSLFKYPFVTEIGRASCREEC